MFPESSLYLTFRCAGCGHEGKLTIPVQTEVVRCVKCGHGNAAPKDFRGNQCRVILSRVARRATASPAPSSTGAG